MVVGVNEKVARVMMNLFENYIYDFDESIDLKHYDNEPEFFRVIELDVDAGAPITEFFSIEENTRSVFPMVAFKGRNGYLAIIDSQHQIWTTKRVIGQMNVADFSQIPLKYWEMMSDKDTVVEWIKFLLGKLNIEGNEKRIEETATKIAKLFKENLPLIEEKLKELEELEKELNEVDEMARRLNEIIRGGVDE